jgi:crossover junction endodeoxyribonuclease RusA
MTGVLSDYRPEVQLFVPGQPAPQGSKKAFRHKHSGAIIMQEDSKTTRPWRADVRAALEQHAGGTRFGPDVPVTVHLRFVMRRLAGMPKTSRGRATPAHTKKPDLDKLTRAVLDAITSAGVWHDDSQVVSFGTLEKRYAEIDEPPGCYIHIHVREARS